MSVKYIEILRSTLCKLKKKNNACLMLSLQIFGIMYLRSFGSIILSVNSSICNVAKPKSDHGW